MSVLNDFLALPRHEFDHLTHQRGPDELVFLVDPNHSEAAAGLHDLGSSTPLRPLFMGTEFEAIAAAGPVWLSATRDSEMAKHAARLCLSTRSGIALAAATPEQALAHARRLLRVKDGSGGDSLLSFYRPSLWAALMLTAGDALDALLGPWEHVLSPAPLHFPEDTPGWLSWVPRQGNADWNAAAPYSLPATITLAQRPLRWTYWIDEHHEAFGNPGVAQLPTLIGNLELLAGHGIYEGRHLLKLAPLLGGSPLHAHETAMTVLQSADAAFIKVERLQQLAATSHPASTL
jgi:hypothetical protein